MVHSQSMLMGYVSGQFGVVKFPLETVSTPPPHGSVVGAWVVVWVVVWVVGGWVVGGWVVGWLGSGLGGGWLCSGRLGSGWLGSGLGISRNLIYRKVQNRHTCCNHAIYKDLPVKFLHEYANSGQTVITQNVLVFQWSVGTIQSSTIHAHLTYTCMAICQFDSTH